MGPAEEEPQASGKESARAEGPAEEAASTTPRPWVEPLLAMVGVLLLAGAVGFGIGYLTRSDSSGPDLSPKEAMLQARSQTEQEVSREMAAKGFAEGKRSGRSHGIIAGGMAAESAVTIKVRQDQAGSAQSAAASAQAELAGMTAAPAPPAPAAGPGE